MTLQNMRIRELSQLVKASDYAIDSSAVAEAIIRRQAARRLLLGGMHTAGPSAPLTTGARGRVNGAARRAH